MTDRTKNPLRVGKIVKPHGIDGELVVDPRTDFPDRRFQQGNHLLVLGTRSATLPNKLTVETARWHQQRILLETREVTDRNQADDLRDTWLGIPTERRIEAPEAFYGHELIGLKVYSTNGEPRGKVSDVHYDETNPLLSVDLPGDRMVLPLSPGLIDEVNRDNNAIFIDFPDGWRKLLERD